MPGDNLRQVARPVASAAPGHRVRDRGRVLDARLVAPEGVELKEPHADAPIPVQLREDALQILNLVVWGGTSQRTRPVHRDERSAREAVGAPCARERIKAVGAAHALGAKLLCAAVVVPATLSNAELARRCRTAAQTRETQRNEGDCPSISRAALAAQASHFRGVQSACGACRRAHARLSGGQHLLRSARCARVLSSASAPDMRAGAG